MTIQNTIFDYITSLFGVDTTPQLGTDDSFAAQIAPSYVNNTFFDGQQDQTLCILLLGKGKDPLKRSEQMFNICNTLNKMTSFEHGIYNVLSSIPSLVGVDDRKFIYSCTIDVKFIY